MSNIKIIKKEEDFLEKYQYIEWERIEWLNNSSTFLTVISYYNLTSPVVNLILPILGFPFLYHAIKWTEGVPRDSKYNTVLFVK